MEEHSFREDGAACCGPGCDCGKPSGGRTARVVISLLAVLAIGGILVYKGFTRGRTDAQGNAASEDATFPVSLGGERVALENGTAKPAQGGNTVGAVLESLGDLNNVALNQDAVFVFVPGKTDEPVSDPTRRALLSAQKKLDSRKVRVGLYTLDTASPDCSAVSSRTRLPAVVVACRGRGMGIVSGEIDEEKLLQAFTASSRAGGSCCPSGSKSGCK
jgi:hypothetical protein